MTNFSALYVDPGLSLFELNVNSNNISLTSIILVSILG